MKKDLKKLKEDKSKKSIFNGFKYAYDGMLYAFYKEKNLVYLFLFAIMVFIVGLILNISYKERLALVVLIGFCMALELVNCAIEKLADAFSKKDNDLKIAKDCSSAGVAIAVIFTIITSLVIFISKIIEVIR